MFGNLRNLLTNHSVAISISAGIFVVFQLKGIILIYFDTFLIHKFLNGDTVYLKLIVMVSFKIPYKKGGWLIYLSANSFFFFSVMSLKAFLLRGLGKKPFKQCYQAFCWTRWGIHMNRISSDLDRPQQQHTWPMFGKESLNCWAEVVHRVATLVHISTSNVWEFLFLHTLATLGFVRLANFANKMGIQLCFTMDLIFISLIEEKCFYIFVGYLFLLSVNNFFVLFTHFPS